MSSLATNFLFFNSYNTLSFILHDFRVGSLYFIAVPISLHGSIIERKRWYAYPGLTFETNTEIITEATCRLWQVQTVMKCSLYRMDIRRGNNFSRASCKNVPLISTNTHKPLWDTETKQSTKEWQTFSGFVCSILIKKGCSIQWKPFKCCPGGIVLVFLRDHFEIGFICITTYRNHSQ